MFHIQKKIYIYIAWTLVKNPNFDLKRTGQEMTSLFLSFIVPLILHLFLLLNLFSPHLSTLSSPVQEQEALQQAEQHCTQLVQARRELEAQVAQLELRVEQEEDANAQLASQRHTLQAECCSLRQDLEELESALSAVEKDKQVMHTDWHLQLS